MNQADPKTKNLNMENKKKSVNSTSLIRLLLKCGTFLHREGNRMVGKYGIKQQQFVVLNEIIRKGPVNQKELIGELLFEKSNVSKIIKILVKKELIKVELSETDRRVTVLTSTSQGYSVWQNCMILFNEWKISFTSSLTQSEISHSVRILEKLPMIINN